MTRDSQQTETNLPSPALRRVDHLCREFEAAWKRDRRERIEDYIAQADDGDKSPATQELLAAEIKLRGESGEPITLEDYNSRFPEETGAIQQCFECLSTNNRRPSGRELQLLELEKRIATLPDYDIQSRLGVGAFGVVFLAKDQSNGQSVALKFAIPNRYSASQLNQFFQEAKTATSLDHPGIVRNIDVRRDNGLLFLVQEYIAGQDLRSELQETRPTSLRTAALMSEVASALGLAHCKGFIHRDLKPGNILIDESGHPHVTDFGLTIHEDIQRVLRGERCGTPKYMSPELVRGESHRLDGRSDIWSLGVIIYEMLTGRMPFAGSRQSELFDEIKHRDPKPPRQIDPDLPVELERICLKCLSKRIADRYLSANDLVGDLQNWLQDENQDAAPIGHDTTVIPRGLRAFGHEDTEFFLRLLPGPRESSGLPESLSFWKRRIEESNVDTTFDVGLLYGPSGCGKTSLVKAGLIPRLASHVVPVYVETTGAETEVRLIKAIRARCDQISDLSLPETIKSIREGNGLAPGKKLLIVLDQFEQWLSIHWRLSEAELVQALRQCDGGRVQCLLMVRDDFWLATGRLLRALEVELVEGHNVALIDLFDGFHARNVLIEFGRAYGRLPSPRGELSAEHEAFVDMAIDGLEQEGRIFPVQLALFAEMFKGKIWSRNELRRIGGTEGVGLTFLDETFCAKRANPKYRRHESAAQAVLRALLPDALSDIRGAMKSTDEILLASGYSNRPKDFAQLMMILDHDLRLITPTDPETSIDQAGVEEAGYYQLTHDFLVRPLRNWLARKQRETVRGRAELRLAEQSEMWNARPVNRYLPTLLEFIKITLFTNGKSRSATQHALISASRRYYGVRCLAVIAFAALAVWLTNESNGRIQARSLVNSVVNAPTEDVSGIIDQMANYRRWVDPLLRQQAKDPNLSRAEKLKISVALLPSGEFDDDYLNDEMLESAPDEVSLIAHEIGRLDRKREHGDTLVQGLRERFQELESSTDKTNDLDLATIRKRTNLAATLAAMGHANDAVSLLDTDDRTVRCQLIEKFGLFDVPAQLLIDELARSESPRGTAALLLALGGTTSEFDPVPIRSEKLIVQLYHQHPDREVHSAAEWLLRKSKPERLKSELDMLQHQFTQGRSGKQWFVNSQGQTMIQLPKPGFRNDEKDDSADEISDSDAQLFVSSTEVTFDQFLEFANDHKDQTPQSGECPVTHVTWFQAVAYCNWLSEHEGLSPCYTPNLQGQYYDGMELADDYRQRDGYRLLTVAEWILACDADPNSHLSCGRDEELLRQYAWYRANMANSVNLVMPVGLLKPNALGMFDMHGNAEEWTQDIRWPNEATPETGGIDKTVQRVLKGGNSQADTSDKYGVGDQARVASAPTSQDRSRGFRIAKKDQ